MKKLLALVTMIAFFASCSNIEDNELSGQKEIRFSSQLPNFKSTYKGTQVAEGQKVGIFISEDAAPTATYEQNISYTADGEGNLAGETLYFPSNGNQVTISAYHPYKEGVNDTYRFTVAADQTDVANVYASDLLFCPQFKQTSTTNPITLKFYHQLSMITYKLSAGNGNPDLTNAQVSVVNAATATEFNRRTGVLGDVSAIQEVKIGQNGGIVVPQTISNGTNLLKIVLKSGKVVYYTTDKELTFKQGTKYTFNLKVNLSEAIDIGTEVEDWLPGDDINGEANEPGEDKMLPSEITYKKNDDITKRYIFVYDDLNRVKTMAIWSRIGYDNILSHHSDYAFEYDGKNSKIIGWELTDYFPSGGKEGDPVPKITDATFTYYADKVVIEKTTNCDTQSSATLFINDKGNLSKVDDNEFSDYTIKDNYLLTQKIDANKNALERRWYKPSIIEDATFYTYDNKKSPFLNMKAEKWLLEYFSMIYYETLYPFFGYNNAKEKEYDAVTGRKKIEYRLTYNAKDYLVSRTWASVEELEGAIPSNDLEIAIQYTTWK